MANEVKPIVTAPEFMAVPCAKINEIAAALKPLMNLKAGKNIVITISDTDITIEAEGGNGGFLPSGALGDTLYYNGTEWTTIPTPTGMTSDPVWRYNLSTNTPYWDEPEGC